MYYIRLRIPKKLIPRTSKPIFIYSLGTKDRHEAYVKSLRINLDFEAWISKVSNNKDRFPALAVEHNGSKFDFDMTIPAEKDAYYSSGALAIPSAITNPNLDNSSIIVMFTLKMVSINCGKIH